jgi:hypothetical protein
MSDQKGVLRFTITVFLICFFVGIWVGGCEAQE